MSRLERLFIIITLPLLVLCAGFSTALAQSSTGKDVTINSYVGEELEYRIGFWYFNDVATGSVKLEKGGNGDYIATLHAYTTGFVDRVLRHRVDTYVSRMTLSEDGKRFITKTFEKTIETTGKTKTSRTVFDYSKGIMTWKSTETGKEDRTGEEKIPEGVFPVDPLAGFYNFRTGAYGPADYGSEYKIPTFPKDGHIKEIYLRIATKDEAEKRIKDERFSSDYLADVKIDKELFGSQSGLVEIIFAGDLIPVEAVAKDLFFFGDVRGTLVKTTFAMGFKKTAPAPDR